MPASKIKRADSFDWYPTGNIADVYPGVANWGISSGTGRRTSTNSLKCSPGVVTFEDPLGTQYAYWKIAFATKLVLWDNNPIMGIKDGATAHCDIRVNTSGVLVATRNATVLATSGVTVSKTNWTQFEVMFFVDNTSGRVVVRVNGNATPDIDFTGDTRNGGSNSSGDRYWMDQSTNREFDDLVVQASSADDMNWLGDVVCYALRPSGAGTNTNATPTGGTSPTVVADTDIATFLTFTGTQKDTYAMADLPSGITTISAVVVSYLADKTDAGSTVDSRPVVLSGGTTSNGSSIVQGTGKARVQEVWDTDPNTSVAWTRTNLNAAEAGVERTT